MILYNRFPKSGFIREKMKEKVEMFQYRDFINLFFLKPILFQMVMQLTNFAFYNDKNIYISPRDNRDLPIRT